MSVIWKTVVSLKYEMRSFGIIDLKWKWIEELDLLGTKCVDFISNSHSQVRLKWDQTSKEFEVRDILELIRVGNSCDYRPLQWNGRR